MRSSYDKFWFQKINTDGTSVTQVMGFYPGSSSVNTKGVIKDDSGHPYDVSFTATVSETKFTIALNDVVSASGIKNYILSTVNGGQEFNCTDAAIEWMTSAAVVLPQDASRGYFQNTPGDYGQALRNTSGSNKAGGNAPTGHGPCN